MNREFDRVNREDISQACLLYILLELMCLMTYREREECLACFWESLST